MDFSFVKIFRALNSNQASWQFSLAITLALVPGLTPIGSAHNLLFVLLAFVLNVNLSLFFLVSAILSPIAYLFDPLFASLGEMILHQETLQTLFTAWYNNGAIRLTHFNNTIVMGSLVISLLLMTPLYFLMQFVIKKYRLALNAFFAKLPVFKSLGLMIGVTDEAAKKPALIRWWGAGLALGISGVVVAFVLIFMDLLLKLSLEYGLSKTLDSTVKIDSLETRLAEGTLDIAGMQLIHKNKTTTIDAVHAQLDVNALFFQKVIIRDAKLGVVHAEKSVRQEPAQPAATKADENTAMDLDNTDSAFSLPDPNELLKKEKLSTIEVGSQTNEMIDTFYKKWDGIYKNDFNPDLVKQWQKEAQAIEKAAKKISKPKELQDILKRAEKLNESVSAKSKELGKLQAQFNKEYKAIQGNLDQLSKLPGEDYENIRKKYSLDQNGAINVAGLLFSQEGAQYLRTAQEYYATLQPYYEALKPYLSSPEDEPKPENIIRSNGKEVSFKEFNPLPAFWLKQAALETALGGNTFDLRVTNGTSDPKIVNASMVVTIDSTSKKQYDSLKAEWTYDGITDASHIQGALEAYRQDPIHVQGIRLKDNLLDITTNIDIKGDSTILGGGKIIFAKTAIDYPKAKSDLEKALAKTVQDVSRFTIESKVSGNLGSPDFKVSSDLDTLLSRSFNKVMAQSIKKFENDLKKAIEKSAKAQLDQVFKKNKELKSLQSSLNKNGKNTDAVFNDITKKVSKKTLEKQAQKSLEKKLKKLF